MSHVYLHILRLNKIKVGRSTDGNLNTPQYEFVNF